MMSENEQFRKTPSILIVDDNHTNLKVLGNVLRGEKYKVSFSDNGPQAIKIAEKIVPDLIMLDVTMPGMDGFETCGRLKEIPAMGEIPIIFLTARTETDDIVKGLEMGAVDYVTKPFNARELLTRVKNHIEFKRHRELLKQEILERKKVQKELEAANQKLLDLSSLDGLTAIANRRRFDESLEYEFKRHGRSKDPLSLIVCDVDFFKEYNDAYGHQKGDDCLKALAAAIKGMCKRPGDLAARYGGEEFTVILPGTGSRGALFFAESLRKAVLDLGIPHKGSTIEEKLTISLGVATLEKNGISSARAFFESADRALYRAKELGRNRSVHSDHLAG